MRSWTCMATATRFAVAVRVIGSLSPSLSFLRKSKLRFMFSITRFGCCQTIPHFFGPNWIFFLWLCLGLIFMTNKKQPTYFLINYDIWVVHIIHRKFQCKLLRSSLFPSWRLFFCVSLLVTKFSMVKCFTRDKNTNNWSFPSLAPKTNAFSIAWSWLLCRCCFFWVSRRSFFIVQWFMTFKFPYFQITGSQTPELERGREIENDVQLHSLAHHWFPHAHNFLLMNNCYKNVCF